MALLESIDKYMRSDVQGGLAILTDHEVIAQRVENALLTEQKEVPNQENYGSRLRSLLWEFKSSLTSQTIKSEIRKTARKDVPKAQIQQISVKRPDKFRYGFQATIFIDTPGLSQPDNYKVEIEMGEV